MKQKVIMNKKGLMKISPRAFLRSKKGLSHIDFAIAVGVTMTVIAFVLSFVTNYMSPSFVLAKTADLKASADSLQQMLFDTDGIPASWEDSSRAPVRVGLKTSVYKMPLQIKDGAGINRSLEAIDIRIIFDQDCKNTTYNHSLRLFDEFLNETSFNIYNATECANNSGFLKEANIVFIANNSANARKAYFFFYSNKTSIAWANYANIYETSLVGYWKFEAVNSTNHTLDESRYKNDGKLYNGSTSCYGSAYCPQLAAGKFGSALKFDGSNDYVNVSDSNSLDITSAVTITAWIKADNVAGDEFVVGKGWDSNCGTGQPYVIYRGVSGGTTPVLIARLTNTTNNEVEIGSSSTTVIPSTDWQFFALTYNGSTAKLYNNGTLLTSATIGGSLCTNAQELAVGARRTNTGTSNYFNGTIDEVKIYNRSLSATEVQQEYNRSASRYVSAEKTSVVSKFKVTAMQGLAYDDVRVSLGLKNHFNVTMCGYSFGRQPPEQVDVVSYQKPVLFWNSTGVASSCIATLSMW